MVDDNPEPLQHSKTFVRSRAEVALGDEDLALVEKSFRTNMGKANFQPEPTSPFQLKRKALKKLVLLSCSMGDARGGAMYSMPLFWFVGALSAMWSVAVTASIEATDQSFRYSGIYSAA